MHEYEVNKYLFNIHLLTNLKEKIFIQYLWISWNKDSFLLNKHVQYAT